MNTLTVIRLIFNAKQRAAGRWRVSLGSMAAVYGTLFTENLRKRGRRRDGARLREAPGRRGDQRGVGIRGGGCLLVDVVRY